MSADEIDPFPWFLNKPLKFKVDDRDFQTRITASQWTEHWRPFLTRLRALWLAAQPRRFLVAIAGPPGSGKSIFTEQLSWIAGRNFLHKELHTAALPMDGFHFPQAYLESHSRKLRDGSAIPLASVKGQYDTIDAPALREHLKLLAARQADMNWPGYSRILHDVVPHKFAVHHSVNLAFVEGNYLLLNKGPFIAIPALFDLRIYIDIPVAKIVGNLMSRHIAGGKTLEQAKEWVKKNDLPNARVVESTRDQADVIIERDPDDEDLSSLTWTQPAAPPTPPAPSVNTPASS